MPEEKREPLKSWGNICQVSKDRRQQPDEEKEEEMKIRRKPETERRKQRRRLGICGGIDDVTAEIVETVKICWSQAELSDGEEQLSRLRGVSLAPVHRPLLRALEEAMVTLGLSYEREYSWDIFSAMMRKQSSCAFKSSELPRGFTNYMRAILVDWLIQVHQRRRLGICGGIDDVTAEIVETVKICWSQAELSDGEEQLSRLRGVSLAPVPRPLLRALEEAMVTLGLSYEREYSWDIFSAMMRKQSSCAFKSSELPRGFTNYMRAILVDWLIQVHESFRCTEETLYLCVHLLNSSMRLSKVNIPTFQLLGMTCLFVACKKEECLFPESTELCFLMENCFTRKQLLRMERKVLTCLKFDLSYSQPLHFLYIVHTMSQCSQQVLHLAKYFLELTLLDIECIVCEPAQLAAAALCLARRVLQERSSPEAEEAWTRAVSLYSVSESALCRIKRCMARAALRAENSETQAMFMKYSIPERMELHPNGYSFSRMLASLLVWLFTTQSLSLITATSEWIQFFKDAGIPAGLAVHYAVSFVDNRIQKNMLMDLSKEFMMDLGITVIGDIIAILKHAKVVYRQDMCKMATEAISSGQTTIQAELRRNANTPATRMIANSLSQDSPPPTPVRKPDNRLSVTVSNKQAKAGMPGKEAKSESFLSNAGPDVSVKRRRVTAEMEGKYIINMPKGTTERTKRILEEQAEIEKGIYRTSVFERLGAESKADATMGSKPTGVFSRLGDATDERRGEEEDEKAVESDGEGSVLQYAGVLKRTAQPARKTPAKASPASLTTAKTRTALLARKPALVARRPAVVTLKRLGKPARALATCTATDKPEPAAKVSVLQRLGKPSSPQPDTQDSRVTSTKSKGFTVTINRGLGSAKVSSSTGECQGAQMDSAGSVSVFKRLGLKNA
ncbi:UNVERIFIED_CONTAM: hypothetical protein FKN15_042724 [Acipenser sinensis]